MNKTEAAKIIAIITASMPSVKLDKSQIEQTANAWSHILRDVPYQTAQQAAFKLLRTRTISVFPTPGELLDAASQLTEVGEPTALEAWNEVNTKLTQYGRYNEHQALASMPPRTAFVARAMGWESMCNTEMSQFSTLRSQFLRLYEQTFEQDRRKVQCGETPMLLGRQMKAIEGVSE
ncbi:MAG: replicative helicase loader/inhibitor [Gammaproteobacteria bacterium]|nr:replicative helicase loader/inhibitor [Gammaproteobacteria bacterium]